MYTGEEIFFSYITIVFFTYVWILGAFYYFKKDESSIGQAYFLATLRKKHTWFTRFLIWAFGLKKNQIRIYYYARWITRISLIIATVVLLLMFLFKWYHDKNFVIIYYAITLVWMILVERIPLVLAKLRDHIAKKEEGKHGGR